MRIAKHLILAFVLGATIPIASHATTSTYSTPSNVDLSKGMTKSSNAHASTSLANRLSAGSINIKDYCGDINIGNQSGDVACVQDAVNSIGKGKILEFYGNTVWTPELVPDMTNSSLSFVKFDGFILNPPSITDPATEETFQTIIPDAVIFKTGSNYDTDALEYRRWSYALDHSFTPMMSFTQVNDGPSSNQQGSEVVHIKAISTQRSTGMMDGLRTYLRGGGLNYNGSFDVNTWSNTLSFGTNWTWGNISEMANPVPFYCPSDASGSSELCVEYDLNELDMTITGPEKPETAYDPSRATRHVFGAGGGHNQTNINKGVPITWAPNTPYFQYQMVLVKDSNNKPYLFYAWNKNAPDGNIGDDPGYAITGSISGSTLTVTDTRNVTIKIDPSNTNSPTCGVMVGWQIYSHTLNKEVRIISQLSGTTCQTGTYQVQDMTTTTTNLNIPSGAISEAKGQPWSTSGATTPAWTFNKGDTVTDGTVVWTNIGPFTADTGSVFKYSGGNDPANGWIERFGTLLETDTEWCYDALIDFSTAQFDPSNPYNVDMRVKPDTYFDYSDKATAATQNLHLLGFKSSDNTLEYLIQGKRMFGISDAGMVSSAGHVAVNATLTLSTIQSGSYTESTEVWCHDCRVPGQATGAGTGRYIMLGSDGIWRSQDGITATN